MGISVKGSFCSSSFYVSVESVEERATISKNHIANYCSVALSLHVVNRLSFEKVHGFLQIIKCLFGLIC